jgi:N-acylneuraminate cytidylyltransferase
LAVIIGRAGSKGLPGKNALPLMGRPLIAHTIEAARIATSIDSILVSTDGEAIAQVAEAMQVPVVRRPDELAHDHATVDAAVRHAVTQHGSAHDRIVILYANVPVRPPDLIDRAFETLRRTGADSVQSYAPVGKHHPHWMVKLEDDGRVRPNVTPTPYRRQDLPPMFLPDGGVIALTRDSLFTIDERDPHAFLGSDRRGIQTPIGSVVDVDDQADLIRAEALLLKATKDSTVSSL